MKKKVLLFIAIFMLISFSTEHSAVYARRQKTAKLRWGTFNIRLDTNIDELAGVGWSKRKNRVADYIKENHIDIVGLQEVLHNQLNDLRVRLPEYDYVGVGRTDGGTKGEYTPVFFLRDRFDVLEKGNFWLSETPDVPGSRGWDAALERIASYVKLKDKATGKVFMAVNTHFDHVGVTARRESAKLIMRKIRDIVGKQPAVVTGDFNVSEDDEAYATMTSCQVLGTDPETSAAKHGRRHRKASKRQGIKLSDAHHMTTNRTGTDYTWHNFCHIPPSECEKIDFIFITPGIRVNHSHIETPDTKNMLSDHNPHWVDLEF